MNTFSENGNEFVGRLLHEGGVRRRTFFAFSQYQKCLCGSPRRRHPDPAFRFVPGSAGTMMGGVTVARAGASYRRAGVSCPHTPGARTLDSRAEPVLTVVCGCGCLWAVARPQGRVASGR